MGRGNLESLFQSFQSGAEHNVPWRTPKVKVASLWKRDSQGKIEKQVERKKLAYVIHPCSGKTLFALIVVIPTRI